MYTGSFNLRDDSATGLTGTSAALKGRSGTLTGSSATLRGSTTSLTGRSGTLTGGSATLRGGSGTLRTSSKTLRDSSAILQGGSATLVSQYAAALHTIAAAQQTTCRSFSQLRSLSPLSHFCCGSPCAFPPQASSVEFDVGSQPHLTPRYTQGVLAMTKQHESAVSLLNDPVSCSVPPQHQRLVSRQQAQLWTQHRLQGMLANRHPAIPSLRSSRDSYAADCTGRGYLSPNMTRNPPAYSCCTACGRAYESQLLGHGRPTASHHPSRNSDGTLEGSGRTCGDGGRTCRGDGRTCRGDGRTCRDDGRSCRDGGRTWGINSTEGSFPQASKVQLAGSTSRALERMALTLRYTWDYT